MARRSGGKPGAAGRASGAGLGGATFFGAAAIGPASAGAGGTGSYRQASSREIRRNRRRARSATAFFLRGFPRGRQVPVTRRTAFFFVARGWSTRMAAMTRLISVMVLSLTVVAGASATANATEVGTSRRFGLGFQVGDPTAIIGKAFIGGDNALDFGLGFGGYGYGWCYEDNGNRHRCGGRYSRDLSLHADFLWQENLVRQSVKLDW